MSTWKIWCDWPHESKYPGRHFSGILVCAVDVSICGLEMRHPLSMGLTA